MSLAFLLLIKVLKGNKETESSGSEVKIRSLRKLASLSFSFCELVGCRDKDPHYNDAHTDSKLVNNTPGLALFYSDDKPLCFLFIPSLFPSPVFLPFPSFLSLNVNFSTQALSAKFRLFKFHVPKNNLISVSTLQS